MKKFAKELFELFKKNKNIIFLVSILILVGTPMLAFLWKTVSYIKIENIVQGSEVNDWFNMVGNTSQVLLVILGCLVFRQITISKEDIKIRCLRESRSRSVEIASMYAKEMVPMIDDFIIEVRKLGHKFTSFNLNQYYKEEIVAIGNNEKNCYDKDIAFLEKNPEIRKKCITILNSLEAFAINFTQRVADEEAVFSALSQTYCNFIKNNGSLICFLRNKKYLIFNNLIELNTVWSERIKDEGKQLQMKELQEQLAECIDANQNSSQSKKITPIGPR